MFLDVMDPGGCQAASRRPAGCSNSWNLRHTFSSPPCSLEKKEDRIHEVYKIFIWHFASGEHCGGQWCVSDFTVTVTHRESCAQIKCVVMYCVNTY